MNQLNLVKSRGVIMDNDERKRTLTIVLGVAVALGVIAGLLYLLFGLALVVQAITFGITFVILSIIILALLVVSIYLWIKLIWLRRDLKNCVKQNIHLESELEKCKSKMEPKNKGESKNITQQIKDIF